MSTGIDSTGASRAILAQRLISLTDRDATVVDWSSRYDCDKAEEEHIDTLLQGLYQSFISGLSTFG